MLEGHCQKAVSSGVCFGKATHFSLGKIIIFSEMTKIGAFPKETLTLVIRMEITYGKRS